MSRALAVLAALAACMLAGCAETAEPLQPDVLEARDRDLLDGDQKQEARETGRAAIRYGGMLYILEDVPEEYYREELR